MFSDEAFILKSYIKRYISRIPPTCAYPGEQGLNPAFQRIEEVRIPLLANTQQIFVLRGDWITAIGEKNASVPSNYLSLTVADNTYDGTAYYAGILCWRSSHLEIYLPSNFNPFARNEQSGSPLTQMARSVMEAYLSLQFLNTYGGQKVIFYDISPTGAFRCSQLSRTYTAESIREIVVAVDEDLGFAKAQKYIKNNILPVKPKYIYPDEKQSINPGYQNITNIHYPLAPKQILIWVLRRDFILACGVKNAYKKEYGYTGFEDSFSVSTHQFIDWKERYAHPSLTLSEGEYDGSVFYAGYLCQREGYLQVYLASGRFERMDLSEEQTHILEAYIAAHFQTAFGNQDIIFDFADSNDSRYHATFFGHGKFDADNLQRRYSRETIHHFLQTIPTHQTALRYGN